MATCSNRFLFPLFGDPSTRTPKARELEFEPCPKDHAVGLVREWHSRLPNCQRGPWTHAFRGHYMDRTYVVALWNNPSARGLPPQWRELRRMACAEDAPRNTPSRFLSWMVRWFKANQPECGHLISYQDTAVHSGTIYKAANWSAEATQKTRVRDRSKPRAGTDRLYRSSINGTDADCSEKVRWGIDL